jgi:hypothetical protein
MENINFKTLHTVFTRRTNGQGLATFHRQNSFENRGPRDTRSAEHCVRNTIYILLLPEVRTGTAWEHPTDNALSKIVGQWIEVPRNPVLATMIYILHLPEGHTGSLGTFQNMPFGKSETNGQNFRGTCMRSTDQHTLLPGQMSKVL